VKEFNTELPLLVIAPHLTYPAINGADISLDRIAKYMSIVMPYVDIIACDRIIRYKNGLVINELKFKNQQRRKIAAAVRTIVFNSNYFKERFLTRQYIKVLKQYIKEHNETYNIIFSFIVSATLCDKLNISAESKIIWTHNDDYKWFLNMQLNTGNPLIKMVAQSSINWTKKFIDKNESEFLLLHVSDDDAEGYLAKHPKHRFMRVNIGTDIKQATTYARKDDKKITLTFVGSLSLKMNLDAINHFENTFYADLKKHFGDLLAINIVGNNPSKEVNDICNKNGWALHPNVSDEEMAEILSNTDFTILPFNYSAGAKLKMVFSLGNGVPFLSTRVLQKQMEAPQYCLFSDDVQEWIHTIEQYKATTDQQKQQISEALITVAQQYSWEKVTLKMFNDLVSYTH